MEKIDNLGFDKYWKQIAYILCLKAIQYTEVPLHEGRADELIEKLDFCYQQFFNK
jgi:hypothetical protein